MKALITTLQGLKTVENVKHVNYNTNGKNTLDFIKENGEKTSINSDEVLLVQLVKE